MSELVERLRTAQNDFDYGDLCQEAADELQRLTEEIEWLREAIQMTCDEFVREHGVGVESDWLLSRLLPALKGEGGER